LGALLWQAWDQKQRIVLTTQLSLEKIHEGIDEALASRLATLAEIPLAKKDMRTTKAGGEEE